MAWQKNGTPNTIGGVTDNITINDLTPLTFNVFLANHLNSGNIQPQFQLGNGSVDVTQNYADRFSNDGGSDSTTINQEDINASDSGSFPNAIFGYWINIVDEEKLLMGWTVIRSTAGAGTPPRRLEWVGKWVNIVAQADHINSFNRQSGDYAVDSNLSALGTD